MVPGHCTGQLVKLLDGAYFYKTYNMFAVLSLGTIPVEFCAGNDRDPGVPFASF